MKRIFLTLLVATTLGLTATSCQKEPVPATLQSMQTKSAEVTLSDNNWQTYPGSSTESAYLFAEVDWPVLDEYVLTYGNVNAYIKINTKVFPLPYTTPITYTLDDGSQVVVPEDIQFFVKPTTHPGKIYFVIRDLDGNLPEGYIEDLTFRIVATWPVDYIINQ